MKIAVIGCGSIGSRHATNLAAMGHVTMLFDADRSKQPYRSPAECNATVDAVMICAPASTHATVARSLLSDGYLGPLFVEKPLALSVEECEIFKAWPHPTTMVGYNWRFNTEVNQLFAIPIPRWRHTNLYCRTDMRSWPSQSYGDPMLECSHEIDLLLSRSPRGHLDHASISAEWASVWIDGAEAMVNWNGNVHETSREFRRGPFRLEPSQESVDESYRIELAHFLDCAQRGVATETPFADGIRVLNVIEQAKAMATT